LLYSSVTPRSISLTERAKYCVCSAQLCLRFKQGNIVSGESGLLAHGTVCAWTGCAMNMSAMPTTELLFTTPASIFVTEHRDSLWLDHSGKIPSACMTRHGFFRLIRFNYIDQREIVYDSSCHADQLGRQYHQRAILFNLLK
jgi:hypothetical protein